MYSQSIVSCSIGDTSLRSLFIMTLDEGPERFFRFQTETGQYREEKRHLDGSVTGTYGWVDPNGILRLFDYISDKDGYRIDQEREFKVCISVLNGAKV